MHYDGEWSLCAANISLMRIWQWRLYMDEKGRAHVAVGR